MNLDEDDLFSRNTKDFIDAVNRHQDAILRGLIGRSWISPLLTDPARYGSWDDPVINSRMIGIGKEDTIGQRVDPAPRMIGHSVLTSLDPNPSTWANPRAVMNQPPHRVLPKTPPAPWTDDPFAPKAPVPYASSVKARSRSAVYTCTDSNCCVRCGAPMRGQQVVRVAPPGLPVSIVHITCLETDDSVEARPA